MSGADANAVPAARDAAIPTSSRAAAELPATGSQSTNASSANSSATNERPANEQPAATNAASPQPATASRCVFLKFFATWPVA